MCDYFNINDINLYIGGFLLALSALMFMIPIPLTTPWHNFRTGRGTLAIAYIVLGVLMMVNGFMGADDSDLSGMITLIISFYQALLYTRICILFLKPRSFNGIHYRILLGAFTLFSIGLAASYAVDERLFDWLFHVGLGLYALQLIYCSFAFTKNYQETLKHLEYVYDEDMYYRLRWVKRCFYSALFIGVMAWFMAVFHASETLNVLCIFIYTAYYLCMVGYFMRYVSNYGFIVKSDLGSSTQLSNNQAITAKSAAIVEKEKENRLPPKDDKQLTERLKKWVEQQKYRDCHKTMDDIVEELSTTRAQLNEHMNSHYNMNFRTWRNSLRIEEAKRLLVESEIPVAGIYTVVGYSDRSNFHRQFTETVGMTPMQYRRAHT